MSYGFGVDSKGNLLHVYWGDKVRLEDCANLTRAFYHSHFDPEVEREKEEYGAWGGLSFVEPGVKVRFPDGVRDAKLCYAGYTVSRDGTHDVLTIHMKDPHYSFEADLVYRVLPDLDLIERRACLRNAGAEDIQIEIVQSAVWSIPFHKDYRMTYATGKWESETQLRSALLTEGKKVIESRRGTTSHHANPWFAIDNGRADEENGNVWFGALAWSGNWKITAEKTAFGHVRVVGGVNEFDFEWCLKPGETFETPVFTGGYSRDGFGGMSRKFHRYQLQHVLPSGPTGGLRKVLYNSWEATTFDIRVEEQLALARKAAKLGVELFVVDDGWFGKRNDDKAGLGDWYVNTDKLPNGLGELIGPINAMGMDFGLWVEPEMVNPDSDLYRRHPDWVYHFPNRDRSTARNQLVLNLSKPEVKQYIVGFMTKLLSENNIKFIKWDMNRAFSEPGWPEAPPERQREIWVRHVNHLYEIWEELRREFPGVTFEACSSGGGRIDLGMLRYADQAWVSDNTDPFDRLSIQEGYSYVYCPKAMMNWVTDSPSHANHRKTSLKYRFHSAMTGALGIGGNLNRWTDAELEEASVLIAAYKEIRPIVQHGRQYRLLSPSEGSLSAVQYVDDDRRESVLFVFLQVQQFGDGMPRIRLSGLEPERVYRVQGDECFDMSGSGLMNIGVPVTLKGDYDSVMIRIRAIDSH